MQIPLPLARPRLESRAISRHGRKIAIMQPIDNFVLLAQARPALRIVWAVHVGPETESGALVVRLGVVGFDEAGADEEQVADLDGAAGGGRADVDALGGAAGEELGVGYCVAVVGVWVLLALHVCSRIGLWALVP
jgi:hypothetical protein